MSQKIHDVVQNFHTVKVHISALLMVLYTESEEIENEKYSREREDDRDSAKGEYIDVQLSL